MIRHLGTAAVAAALLFSCTIARAQTTDVLLVQTAPPWSTDSNELCLDGLGMTYDFVTDWDLIDWTALGDYRVMLIVNDQAQPFYDDYAVHQQDLEQFVMDGGDLLFFAAGAGWAGGYINAPLPGGLPWHFDVANPADLSHYNEIVDATHPIVTSQLSDSIPLTNAEMDGNYCSHGWFHEDDLPNECRVIFRQSVAEGGHPTTIDYRLGMGHVVASTNTWEFHYAGLGIGSGYDGNFAIQNLDDVFLYMLAVGGVTAPDAVIYQHYLATTPDCMFGEVEVGETIHFETEVANIALVDIATSNVHFSYQDASEISQTIDVVSGTAIPAESSTVVGVDWDTTGLDAGEYLLEAEVVVISPQELVENQDNNYSARYCTLTLGSGDDDDDAADDDAADDDAAGDDDDAGADDDDGGGASYGCECHAAPQGAGAAAAVVALAGLLALARRR